MKIKTTLSIVLTSIAFIVSAQPQKSYTSSEIYLRLQKLNVLGSVLYIAAHPDDENTRMITFLENEGLVSAAYLSMTRGDGGQNLIGPEIREQLGIIRTQELLAARRRDGGEQFFTRANDFGYSKNAEETQEIWDRDLVLADIVWTYRIFRPDVIITRFPANGGGGHGHHTTSAILAVEAFELSGDPSIYSEQLKFVDVWQPERIFTNTGRWWNTSITSEDEGVVTIDVGQYNPLLGQSYSEIAAVSRSQHKSQGFGSTGSRGEQEEFLELINGGVVNDDLFEGIDITWNRVKGSGNISSKISNIVSGFIIDNPEQSISALLEVRKIISQLEDPFWVPKKLLEIDELIRMCGGLYLEVVASQYYVVPDQELNLRVEVTNRSGIQTRLKMISVENIIESYNLDLPGNNSEFVELNVKLPVDKPISNPYWLNHTGSLGMYIVNNQKLIGKPENDPAIQAELVIEIDGTLLNYRIPVVYKWNDRVKGELRRRVEVIPPVLIQIENSVVIFPSSNPKKIDVKVTAGKVDITPKVQLNLPPNWKSEPVHQMVSMHERLETKTVSFMVSPPDQQEEFNLVATAELEGRKYDRGISTISYDHIPIQTLFPEANSKLVRLDIRKRGATIGYIMGAGDAMPASLEQIGYNVWEMNIDDISPENLAGLDAVIMGIRALNTHPELKNNKETLLNYVNSGGTLIYQYNTSRGIDWEDFAPYEIGFTGRSSDSRVSVEEAEITILKPNNEVLNSPNKITSKDFEGWVQERGLYFPSTWSGEYEAILSSHDPGEDPKNGGLLVARYGDGYFVYTGYAWFRQLPAGVPGAFRLFANIISLGNKEKPDKTALNSTNK